MPYIVFFCILIIINIIYVKSYKTIRNLLYKISLKKEGKEFKRDIDKEYSPSIVSYLYNQQIEFEKDLISDILNLYARKIIDIKQEKSGEYSIVLEGSEYKEDNIHCKKDILENDMYIIDTIVLKKRDFKYEEWQRKIKNVYREHIIKNTENDIKKKFENYIQKHIILLRNFNDISYYNF